ncbi:Histone-lysine N-methyltransferase ASHH2-like protein [Drosera capensis]
MECRDEGGDESGGLAVMMREEPDGVMGSSVESGRGCVENSISEKNDLMEMVDQNGGSLVELAVVCKDDDMAYCSEAEAAAASDSKLDLNSEIKMIEEGGVCGLKQPPDIECRVSKICLSEADECKGESTSCSLDLEAETADNVGSCCKVDLSNSSGDGQMCTYSLLLDTAPSSSLFSIDNNQERRAEDPSFIKDVVAMQEKDGSFCGLEAKLCSEVSLRDADCETLTFGSCDLNVSGSCDLHDAAEGAVDADFDAGKSNIEISAVQSSTELVNEIIVAATSISVDDMSCRVCDDGRDHGSVDEAREEKLLEGQSSSLRRSSRGNKYVIKEDKPQVTRKSSMKPSKTSCRDGTIDFFLKTVRRKRSCSRKPTRSSCWGFQTNFEQVCGTTALGIPTQDSRKVKSGRASKIQKKSKAITSSSASRTKSVQSGTIRLKVVFGKKADQGSAQVTPSQGLTVVDGDKVISGDNVLTSSLPYMKVENSKKDTRKLSQISPFCFPSNNLNESMTCKKLSEDDHSVCKDVALSIIASKAVQDHSTSVSLMDLRKSCYNHERCSDPGTSPDSEVINNVMDSQTRPVALGVQDSAVDSFDCKTNGDASDSSRNDRNKGNIKSQANNLHVEDGVNCPDYKAVIKVYKKSRHRQKAVRPQELHPINDAQVHKLSKSSKSSSRCRNKTTISAAVFPKEETSYRCERDSKKPIHTALVMNDNYDEDDKKEVFAEAGKDVDDETTSNTNSGVTSGDASSQETVPCGDIAGPHKLRLKDAWVCCDACDKWRRIPAPLADIIEKTNCRWTCKDNHDKAFAECSIPQEKSDEAINTELELSDEEDGPDAYSGSKTHERSHVHQPPSWTHISTNLFLHRSRKTQTMDEVMICGCKPPKDGKVGCRSGCLNRMLNIECVRGTCPCGDLCSNQQFQKRKYAPLKLFRCGKKGHGLQVLEDVVEGQFIIEYVGEVLDLPTYDARQRNYASNGHKHFYFMTLDANEVIDACAKGNLGRYINHSCDPNCSTEKWMVNGEICIGLFANRTIKKGEELVFDYNYVRVFGAAAKKCYCGAAKCRGYIGGDVNAEEVVQADSDDEYLDPVVVYENGEVRNGLDNVNALSNFMDIKKMETERVLPEQSSVTSTEELDMAVNEEKSDTTVEQLVMDSGKDSSSESLVNLSDIDGSFGKSESIQADVSEKSATHHQTEIPSEREIVGAAPAFIQSPDSSSENGRLKKCSSEYAEGSLVKSEAEMVDSKQVHPKLHPRMKISRSSRPVKNHNAGINIASDKKASVAKIKSDVLPMNPKRLPDNSANHKLETVEKKLNDLLDVDGGICKRKDASRGYLKLLLLTAASGDNGPGHGGTIQRNRDLSMILDALLKTKSRRVLADIIDKNGLQMLHNMMKQYRWDFNRTPILRKLLKVLEFLAERDALTGERINADPRCLGVESLRESLLALTEHQDKKVHQIARSFRDKWIPRVRKISSMDTDDRKHEANRSTGTQHRWHDYETRPTEAIVCMNLTEQTQNTLAARMEVSPSPHVNNGVTAFSRTRKRKSRWDQPSDQSFPFKQQKLWHIKMMRHDDRSCFSDCMQSSYEGMMGIQEDAPPGFSPPPPGFSPPPPGFSSPLPGFSSPLCGSHLQSFAGSIVAGIPFEVSIGQPQKRFISRSPVAYGIPFLAVQQYGTPQRDQIDDWAVAPGVPFQPFPPLPPSHHCREENGDRQNPVAVTAERGVSQDHCVPVSYRLDQDTPSTSSSVCYDVVAAPVVALDHPPAHQREGGNSGILGRKYFKQQKWKGSRPRPPWLRRKEWGFKGNHLRNGAYLGPIPVDQSGLPPDDLGYHVRC